MLAVLGHRAACDGISFLFQYFGQFVIGQRFLFVLAVDAFFQDLPYLAYRHLFTVFGGVSVAEEELQGINAVIRLHVFAVADA